MARPVLATSLVGFARSRSGGQTQLHARVQVSRTGTGSRPRTHLLGQMQITLELPSTSLLNRADSIRGGQLRHECCTNRRQQHRCSIFDNVFPQDAQRGERSRGTEMMEGGEGIECVPLSGGRDERGGALLAELFRESTPAPAPRIAGSRNVPGRSMLRARKWGFGPQLYSTE